MGWNVSRGKEVLRRPAFSLVLAGCALALFSWPILRRPPPDATVAYLFLFAAWALVILALAIMARSAGDAARGRGSDGGAPDA